MLAHNLMHSWSQGFNPTAPLTIRSKSGNNAIHIYRDGNPNSVTLKYSTNHGYTWSNYSIGGTISFNGDQEVWLSGTTTRWNLYSDPNVEYYYFAGDGNFSVGGNLLSLVNGSTQAFQREEFAFTFANTSNLVLANNLTFPSIACSQNCYYSMFKLQRYLEKGPAKLPATSLAYGCYYSMFLGCNKLKYAPILPATVMALVCYADMFQGCGALSSIPALPATTLAPYCYNGMFRYCGNLSSVYLPFTSFGDHSCLGMFSECNNLHLVEVNFTEWPTNGGTDYWLEQVASNGTFICPESLPLIHDEHHIPVGWTVVKKP